MMDELEANLRKYVAAGRTVGQAALLCGVNKSVAEEMLGDLVALPDEGFEEDADIKELARRCAPDAVRALLEIARNGRSESSRVQASTALLDRGYGRPAQTHDLQGITSINIIGLAISPPGSKMPTLDNSGAEVHDL